VLDAGVIGASRAEEIPVEVRQVVVVALEDLDQLPMPETVSTASTDARLGPDHSSSQDVIAGMAELPIGAVAGLLTSRVGDVVGVLAVQARDVVVPAAMACGDLLEVVLGEGHGPEFAGVGDGARVRYSHDVNLLSRLAGSRGVLPPAVPFTLCPYRTTSRRQTL
jgi:hypothetical protein